MNCKLTFIFTDETIFGAGFKGRKILQVENPPFIPNPGDTVTFNIEDFTEDQETIENFGDFHDNDLFFCDLHSKTYGKEMMEIKILVYPERRFREECPKLYSRVSEFSTP
jgi:hypothetical protein